MPFYFRKSVTAGPFRFNFSSGGIGVSVGVKGFRVGTGPRGHYVHAGRNGFYYRASLSGPRAGNRPFSARSLPLDTDPPVPDDMVLVTSGDVLAMQDTAFADFLHEINAKSRQVRMATAFGSMAAVLGLICLIIVGPAAFVVLAAIPVAWLIGHWMDSYRRVAVLFYEMDDMGQSAYERLCAAFDALSACHGKWHIEAGKAVRDLTTWKREAGASHLVNRRPLTISYRLPPLIRCNLTPPAFFARGRIFHLLPDVVLVQDATGFGAVGYDALRISHHLSNFIESGTVPRDAQISHHTWQHPNKSGGPDRRFKSNRLLPVCRYETMHLASSSGINEIVEFSRTGLVQEFVSAVAAMPRNAGLDKGRLLPSANEVGRGDVPFDNTPAATSDLTIVGIAAVIMAIVAALAIYFVPHRSFNQPAEMTAPASAIIPADELAVVVPKQLNCRAEADASSSLVRTYDRRARVHLIGRQSGWAQIEDPNGDCWVNAQYLTTKAGPAKGAAPPSPRKQVAVPEDATPPEVQTEPGPAPISQGIVDQPEPVAGQVVDTFTTDAKIAKAVQTATRKALESGRAEMWRAAKGKRGYVVPSQAETYGSQICRNAFVTLIDGNRQDRSNPIRWCKPADGDGWSSE